MLPSQKNIVLFRTRKTTQLKKKCLLNIETLHKYQLYTLNGLALIEIKHNLQTITFYCSLWCIYCNSFLFVFLPVFLFSSFLSAAVMKYSDQERLRGSKGLLDLNIYHTIITEKVKAGPQAGSQHRTMEDTMRWFADAQQPFFSISLSS